MANARHDPRGIPVPSPHDWRTTDEDELNKRRRRALEESFVISNLDARHPVFSDFRVKSGSGLAYQVEIRDVLGRQFGCDCVDFRINGLGSCKHVEAVLLHLDARHRRLFRSAAKEGSTRTEVVLDSDRDTIRLRHNGRKPASIRKWFESDGRLRNGSPEAALEALKSVQASGKLDLRISREIDPWLENRRRIREAKTLRRDYELKVQSGEWPQQETKVPLFPYQREGMLHLAFTERALLADEMGLGKTIQAIAACALLHRLGQARRVLVVTPASLKSEWEEQIERFTDLPRQVVFGGRRPRLRAYDDAPFFTIVNYEQMIGDALDVNERLKPDVVILDEAQRIKNWSTKTARAVKRLRSRYAFVLTGTPIENRIDELHSLMDFLNPSVLGPLFRFNRDFYQLDDRGRPEKFRNLAELHERIRPHMIRRRKAEVETELPERSDRNHFVKMSDGQQASYACHELEVARLVQIAKRRPLTKQQQDKLQRELAMMRMICDTNFILDPEDRECPKLSELEKLLEECRENGAKIIVFSEWERMLTLVRDLCESMGLGYAWHTGTVPQKRRRGEINAFKTDPECRVFLSTDSGSTGLNLQNASVVVNCDLPWNPAKLEQRIARAWRKNQTRPVLVINLVSEKTIEHRMLETLAGKQALADGVLDLSGNLEAIPVRRGQQAFLEKLQQMVTPPSERPATPRPQGSPLPADRALAFSQRAREQLNGALVRCEERYPAEGCHSVLLVVVDKDRASRVPSLEDLHGEFFGPGNGDPLAPVQLEVIDRATDEALQRLIAAGLVASTTRSSRPLYPEPEGDGLGRTPLSAAERARMEKHRSAAQRKLKMARLLAGGGMEEEARPPLLEAVLELGRSLAAAHRLPEPGTVEDAVRPPLSGAWRMGLETVRAYVMDSEAPWEPSVKALEARLETSLNASSA